MMDCHSGGTKAFSREGLALTNTWAAFWTEIATGSAETEPGEVASRGSPAPLGAESSSAWRVSSHSAKCAMARLRNWSTVEVRKACFFLGTSEYQNDWRSA